jgi:hypothetical protein
MSADADMMFWPLWSSCMHKCITLLFNPLICALNTVWDCIFMHQRQAKEEAVFITWQKRFWTICKICKSLERLVGWLGRIFRQPVFSRRKRASNGKFSDVHMCPEASFFKRIFAPTRQARAYATVAFGWVGAYMRVGAYAQVGAYASFKKLPSGA